LSKELKLNRELTKLKRLQKNVEDTIKKIGIMKINDKESFEDYNEFIELLKQKSYNYTHDIRIIKYKIRWS